MEADSTTNDPTNSAKGFPFNIGKCNLSTYKEFIGDAEVKNIDVHTIERLQTFGLLPKIVQCPENNATCKVICKQARVVDKVQWICQGCMKKQPIRVGSFFYRLQCSIIQALQIILAWCEDCDLEVAAKYFDVKPRVASAIYTKLDELAASELNNAKLGGYGIVVLAEMYPNCLNRLSPDTTDMAHEHRILMLADTKHIPTQYRLHVMKNHLMKLENNANEDDVSLQLEIEKVLSDVVKEDSLVVTSNNLPPVKCTANFSELFQVCDIDMQHYLSNGLWSQALTLCNATRDFSGSIPSLFLISTVQRYLDTALYRIRYGDGFYEHMLRLIADKFTDKTGRVEENSVE